MEEMGRRRGRGIKKVASVLMEAAFDNVWQADRWSGHVSFRGVDKQFPFEEFCYFDHGVVVLTGSFAKFPGIDRDAGVDVVVKGQDMTFVQKVPHQRVEIVGFLCEFDIEVVGEDVCHFIEAFQSTVVVDNSLCAAEIGA
jgi:hypothetical protein